MSQLAFAPNVVNFMYILSIADSSRPESRRSGITLHALAPCIFFCFCAVNYINRSRDDPLVNMPSKPHRPQPTTKSTLGMEKKTVKEAIAESEARGLDFDPSARIEAVNKLMSEVPRLKESGLTLNQVKKELGELAEQYPELLKKIYEGEDLKQLELMMKMMEHMERRELTPHQASVIIGRQLANEYIPTHLQEKEKEKTD